MSEARRIVLCLPRQEAFLVADADAEALIERLRSQGPAAWTDFALIKDADDENSGWISVFHAGERGWIILCHGESDQCEHFLVQPSSDDRTPITVIMAGAPETFAARLFVSEHNAMNAVRGYIATLERPPGEWIEIGEG